MQRIGWGSERFDSANECFAGKATSLNKAAVMFHSSFWPVAFTAWLLSTTAYHPNWTLRVVCTFILVAASAIYACCFAPPERTFPAIAFSSLALLACGIVTAVLIHVVYDWSIGPDPRRFGLAQNILMDTAVVLFNTVCAYVTARVLQRALGRSLWRLRST